MQACFKQYKAGRCMINLLKWMLDYWQQTCSNTLAEETFSQHGIRPRDAQLSMSKLFDYIFGTVLDPQSAAPEDMAYFGSFCFQPCMQHFKSRVDIAVTGGYRELLNADKELQSLSAFAACAGVPHCFNSWPPPWHLMHGMVTYHVDKHSHDPMQCPIAWDNNCLHSCRRFTCCKCVYAVLVRIARHA